MTGARRLLLAFTVAILAVSGCARLRPTLVKPHQRMHLSDRIMRSERGGLGDSADQHVLQTREGAVGGTSTAGGGCGCN
ncbi:MAG TPA: DUF4266 domain-containing protein [Polyangia bacterium]